MNSFDGQDDRRRSPRTLLQTTGAAQVDGTVLPISTRDLSSDGAKILLTAAPGLNVGARVRLWLTEPRMASKGVVHWIRREGSAVKAGIEFVGERTSG